MANGLPQQVGLGPQHEKGASQQREEFDLTLHPSNRPSVCSCDVHCLGLAIIFMIFCATGPIDEGKKLAPPWLTSCPTSSHNLAPSPAQSV